MASRYWVGGTNTWNSTAGTKWATTSGGAGGATVPGAADDVFFDANSGAVTVTVALAFNTNVRSITCTGFVGTLTTSSSAVISVSQNLTLVAGMTFSLGSAAEVNMTGTGTLTTAGKIVTNLVINAPGATVTLGDALTVATGSTDNFEIRAGTFSTSASNYSVTSYALSSSNTNTRTISLNASTVTLTSTGTAWNTSVATGLTINSPLSTIICSSPGPTFDAGSGNQTFGTVSFTNTSTGSQTLGGSNTYTAVNFSSTGLSNSITGANTVGTLTVNPTTSTGINGLILSANQTVTSFVCAGPAANRRIFVRSNALGTPRTITATTYTTKTDVDFRDITAAGASAPWSGTRLGDCGGNSNITFPAPKTVYWNGGTGSWGAAEWAATSGGAVSVNNMPLAQDTAVFNNANSVSTVTVDANWNLGTFDGSARTTAMTFTCANNLSVFGNWTFPASGISITGAGAITFIGRSAQTITTNGQTFSQRLQFENVSGGVTLVGALTTSSNTTNAVSLVSGTFNAAGYNVTASAGGFASSGTSTRTLAMGSGTWTFGISGTAWNTSTTTGLTVTGSPTVSFTAAVGKTFTGGSFSGFSGITLNQGGAGALTISGSNSFANITNTYAATGATTLTFTAGTTTTVGAFTASGSPGKTLTIGSTTTSQATLSKSSGTVSVNYVSISYSNATGGATWNAGPVATFGASVTGWNLIAGSSFMIMFKGSSMLEILGGGVLGSLIGGVFRLAPEVLKWLDKKSEREHELKMFEQQCQLEMQRGAQKLQEIGATHQMAVDTGVLGAFQSAIEQQTEMVKAAGKGWVASLSASVRPMVTYWILFLWSFVHIWLAWNSWTTGVTPIEVFKTMMTADFAALVSGTINYWFLDRTLAKRGL